jgi:hypothetical protein
MSEPSITAWLPFCLQCCDLVNARAMHNACGQQIMFQLCLYHMRHQVMPCYVSDTPHPPLFEVFCSRCAVPLTSLRSSCVPGLLWRPASVESQQTQQQNEAAHMLVLCACVRRSLWAQSCCRQRAAMRPAPARTEVSFSAVSSKTAFYCMFARV